jgi:hypothetical protein
MNIPVIGNLIGKIVDMGGEIIKKLVREKDLATRLEHEFRSQMGQNAADFNTLVVETEERIFADQQKTIQAELQQSDLYTKRARPKIATKSFYAGLIYVLMSRLPVEGIVFWDWTIMPFQYEWEVLMLLYAPALTYMGVRGFEKWKAGGAKA